MNRRISDYLPANSNYIKAIRFDNDKITERTFTLELSGQKTPKEQIMRER